MQPQATNPSVEAPSALMRTGGVVNTLIQALGGSPVPFMTSETAFRHMYVWSGVWNALMLLAAVAVWGNPSVALGFVTNAFTNPQALNGWGFGGTRWM